ncbi:MAG: HAD family hydrolase [Pegethrix bostrychoides GSE-TBD4-15B]|jgi:phosphoglycolate phosphatase-like HAD superfamily hydrolase|uniref:HAD family hydrolase n=1 Tax=Pegethrix bostrychoides GSE-TBD4-15B TaxID=2839662 RepID=A0A951PDL7_9CYAN|nr:HAD family hydrolase [Pegethrix bostrychoides GSE-TBD4-15B]
MIHAEVGSAQVLGGALQRSASPQVTLFCDFDGPIVDVSDRYYHTYQRGLAEIEAASPHLMLHRLSKPQFWQMKQERTPDVEIAMRSGLQGKQIEQFLSRVKQIVNQPDLLAQDQIQPGVKWALSLLHGRGFRLVLVTLRQQVQASQILQDHGLETLFGGIWGTHDDSAAYLNQSEHKTYLLEQAMQQFDDGSAWMVGDTEADVLAGQSLGIPTIALTCGIRSRSYLQKLEPTRIHADLLSATRYLMNWVRMPQALEV